MKIELMRNDANKVVGYKLLREDGDDIATVEQVRDMLFWGMDEDVIDYNGRRTNEKGETIELKFATKAHKKEEYKKINHS